MKTITTLIALGMALCGAEAQTVSGRVIDENANPVPYANVVLTTMADSTFAGGTVTADDGLFSLATGNKKLTVNISCMGYTTRRLPAQSQMGDILLEPDTLTIDEVTVRGQQARYQLKGDGMKTTVAGTLMEKAGSMEQLLKLIPYVYAKDGSIEVFGRGTPEIYINGRKMIDNTELQRYQSEDIESIEVVNNPGSRYGASVTSVIRITTKKAAGDGLSFVANGRVGVNDEARQSNTESVSLNYRTNGLDVNGFVYNYYGHRNDDKQLRQYTFLQNDYLQTLDMEQEYTNFNPYARLGASYAAADNNSFGASLSYDHYAKNNGKGTSQVRNECNNQLTDATESDYESPARTTAWSANTYYLGKIGRVGIDFNADYYSYAKKQDMTVSEFAIGQEADAEDVVSHTKARNTMLAEKLIVSIPLWQGELSLGEEFSGVRRRTRYNIEPSVTDNENDKICESLTSAFMDYRRDFGKLNVQAGIRYEYVDFDYYDDGVRIAEQSKAYGNWFPSVALSWPAGQTQMQLTYATDIRRPSYWELRSGVQYDNQYTYESGNPFLNPSISRNLTYALTWNWLNLQLCYMRKIDEDFEVMQAYKGDPMKSLMSPENVDDYDILSVAASVGNNFGLWHPRLDVELSRQWFTMDNHDADDLAHPLLGLTMVNTFEIPWFTLTLTSQAQTKGHDGNSYYYKAYFDTDLTLTKTMMNDRLRLQLSATDLFHTADVYMRIYSGTERTTEMDRYSQSTWNFSVRYTFNSYSSKYRGTGAGSAQRDRM